MYCKYNIYIYIYSKKYPTGPTERTPEPEYLIARSQLTERGPLARSHSIFDGYIHIVDLCIFSSLEIWTFAVRDVRLLGDN